MQVIVHRLFLFSAVLLLQWNNNKWCLIGTTTALLNKGGGGGGGGGRRKPLQQQQQQQSPWEDVLSKVNKIVGKSSKSSASPSPSSSSSLMLLSPQERRDLVLSRLNMTSSVEPRPFSIQPYSAIPSILGASLPAILRLGTGAFAEGYNIELGEKDSSKYTLLAIDGIDKQLVESSRLVRSRTTPTTPTATTNMEPLILYDREGSAACRLIREACSILSLTVMIRPCPEKGLQFASALRKNGQIDNLPILDDPNTGISGLSNKDNSDDTAVTMILNYLFKTYGNGELPWTMKLQDDDIISNGAPLVPSSLLFLFTKVSTWLAMASRLGSGSRYETSDPPPLPLTLWSYEGSPFCKIVTERLGSLELEYKVIYCPRGSPNRQALMDLTGNTTGTGTTSSTSSTSRRFFQVPYLQDPNTGVDLWESSAICEYLTKQYALETSVAYL